MGFQANRLLHVVIMSSVMVEPATFMIDDNETSRMGEALGV